MIQTIKTRLLLAASTIMLVVPVLATPLVANGDCSKIANAVQNGANSSLPNASGTAIQECSSSTGANTDALQKFAKKVITWFSILVGAASVFMIIYGGFRYITSGGESGRVGAAKNSLLYAIVGLVIVALAQLIIHFVLNQASQVGTSSS
ncbi:MAG TPA: pilin [Candidatus Saccharimonadales bacterium]|nr:pilin [Candidatus Saccharimonadales bacterium]